MITIVGLGPGSLDRLPDTTRRLLLDESRPVLVRTLHHPAAEELAELRAVESCDEFYTNSEQFDDVYSAIAKRVLEMAGQRVIYAVPGSPGVGEFAVGKIRAMAANVEVVPGESFVDAVLELVGYDPLDRGLQILNGHELPAPLVIDKPTIVAHLDRPEVLADVCNALSRVVAEESQVVVVRDGGSANSEVVTSPIDSVDPSLAGLRTSLFVDAEPRGMVGAVATMRRLRGECPWDREQTHQSLVKNLIEESYELVEAISLLDDGAEPDWVGLAKVEEELGDVLLQVLFHSVIAEESTAFDADSVATVMTEKLIRRHPHVFGDVSAETADQVKSNWDAIKAKERGADAPESLMDGIPSGMPSIERASKIQNRAAKVGFDWQSGHQVMGKLHEEIEEMKAALTGDGDVDGELGDLLFTLINLARHVGSDPEVALRRASARFESRFRSMETAGDLAAMTPDELEALWHQAKSSGST